MSKKELIVKGLIFGISIFLVAEFIGFVYMRFMPSSSNSILINDFLVFSKKIVNWICFPFSHILKLVGVRLLRTPINLIGWIVFSITVLYLKNKNSVFVMNKEWTVSKTKNFIYLIAVYILFYSVLLFVLGSIGSSGPNSDFSGNITMLLFSSAFGLFLSSKWSWYSVCFLTAINIMHMSKMYLVHFHITRTVSGLGIIMFIILPFIGLIYLLLPEVRKEFKWSRAKGSELPGFLVIVYLLVSPVVGRFGPAKFETAMGVNFLTNALPIILLISGIGLMLLKKWSWYIILTGMGIVTVYNLYGGLIKYFKNDVGLFLGDMHIFFIFPIVIICYLLIPKVKEQFK